MSCLLCSRRNSMVRARRWIPSKPGKVDVKVGATKEQHSHAKVRNNPIAREKEMLTNRFKKKLNRHLLPPTFYRQPLGIECPRRTRQAQYKSLAFYCRSGRGRNFTNSARESTLRSWLSEKAAPSATENDVRSATTVCKGTAMDVHEVSTT